MNKQLTPFWTLFILTGLNLFNYLDRQIVPAVVEPLKNEFALSDGQVGRINTFFMWGYFLTSPVFGLLGDRASRKWLIATGILVWSAGTLCTGFAKGFVVLLFFRALVGVGEASYATISPGWLADTFGPEKRNNALTIYFVAMPVGAALGYAIGGFVAEHYGWRWAFIWAGAPGLLLALTLLPFREPERGQAEGRAAEKPKLGDTFKILRLPDYNLVVWGYVAYIFALGAFAYWGPTFLQRAHGMAKDKSNLLFGAMAAGAGLVGTLIGGFVATAWQRRSAAGYAWMLGCSVLGAVPMAVVAFWVSDTALSVVFLAAAMVLMFMSTGPVNTLILESVPANLRASAMAISIFMIHLFGDMWSSEIVGHLSDRLGSLQKAVMILPGALCVAAALWLGLVFKIKRATASHQQQQSP